MLAGRLHFVAIPGGSGCSLRFMASTSKRSPVAPGQQLAGKYRVEREIGAGSMGVVVEAWHIELDQRVAIKFLYPEFASNREGAERFRREARASAGIESEHVAKVLDIGTLDEGHTLYYVMEFLRGHDLSRELALHGPLPVRKAVDYVLETCDALEEAHAKGIVHRDLKPANLFLVERPNGGQMVKVVDFGISKITGNSSRLFSLTDTSIMMGSPAYMCPEQLESSRNVDARADIWSLGVILHELIMGEIPFRGESVPQLVGSILLGKRLSLTLLPGVPAELDAVVERCLRQNREDRFASIHQLREALVPFSTLGRRAPSSVPVAVSSSGVSSRGRVLGTPVTPVPPSPAGALVTPVPASQLPQLSSSQLSSSQLSSSQLSGSPSSSSPSSGYPLSGSRNESARSVMAPLSYGGASFDSASVPPELEPEALGGAGLKGSGSAPVSWGGTQRGQTWRQAMFRRGLPAALFAALALGGAYWMLRARTGPAAKLPTASTDVSSSESERSASARPAPAEPPAEKPGESGAEQPVVRALKPAPPEEAAPAPEQPSQEAPRAAEARLAPVNAERAKPPASASKAVKPSSTSGVGKAPAAARPEGAAAGSAAEQRDAKTTRPNFLNKLEGQDYGGRE